MFQEQSQTMDSELFHLYCFKYMPSSTRFDVHSSFLVDLMVMRSKFCIIIVQMRLKTFLSELCRAKLASQINDHCFGLLQTSALQHPRQHCSLTFEHLLLANINAYSHRSGRESSKFIGGQLIDTRSNYACKGQKNTQRDIWLRSGCGSLETLSCQIQCLRYHVLIKLPAYEKRSQCRFVSHGQVGTTSYAPAGFIARSAVVLVARCSDLRGTKL